MILYRHSPHASFIFSADNLFSFSLKCILSFLFKTPTIYPKWKSFQDTLHNCFFFPRIHVESSKNLKKTNPSNKIGDKKQPNTENEILSFLISLIFLQLFHLFSSIISSQVKQLAYELHLDTS